MSPEARLWPRIHPRPKVRKPLKRPALRGDVTQAGVACDARLLSCSFFKPSALPLPWVFCRNPARQNWALSEAESVTGRLGDFPASRRFFLRCSEVSMDKTVPCDNGPHRPRHRVSASQRYTVPPSPQAGHKPPYNAKQGALRFWAVICTKTGSY